MTFLLANLYSYKTTFDCKDWFGEPKEQTDPDDPLESEEPAVRVVQIRWIR